MSKVKSLIDKYGIACLSNSNLEMFISETYGDGYQACEEKYKDKLGLRDHFAGLAMQTLYSSNVKWEPTGEERDEESVDLIKELAHDAYHMADAMLAEREKE